jgi:hypothetical protein
MTSATLLLFAALAACSWPTDQRAELPTGALVIDPQAPLDTTLGMSADTYLRQGHPNHNYGADTLLRVRSSGHNRALLQVDPTALAAAAGGGTLLAARLELTITANADNWGPDGREIALHRMTTPWTELGATWNCAVDSVPGNQQAECAGETAWEMGSGSPNPWVATPTATATMTNGLSEVVTFDVTADVAAWLGGTLNAGWILKKVNEGATGRVEFGSRESGLGPALVLTLQHAIMDTVWVQLDSTYPEFDTSRVVVVRPAPDTFAYFRTDIQLYFKPGVSNSAKAAFFAQRSITVLGVTSYGKFFVRIPDPGPTLENFYSALDTLAAAAEVDIVAPINRSPRKIVRDARYPTDGVSQARADWLSASAGTWAARAIHAPLAWGCETGTYGGAFVPVGVFEWKHQQGHPDYARSMPQLWEPRDADLASVTPVPDSVVRDDERHAVATTGLLSAEGDNGSGIAGVDWQTNLHLYAGRSPGNRALPLTQGLYVLANRLVPDGIRVLNLSVDQAFDSSEAPANIERITRSVAADMQSLMDRLPSLIIVVAGGNSGFRGTVATYIRSPRAAVMRAGLLLLKSERPQYRGRIIVVAGTVPGNSFWTSGDFYDGMMDLAAPAENVTVLDRWTGQTGSAIPLAVATGTSVAAPMVSGTAGLLLAFDPALSPDSVKDYIVRGAMTRLNLATDSVEASAPVAGAAETIYQLDAYGSLALLSRERPNTPICGFPVFARNDAVFQVRVPGDTQAMSVPVPTGDFLGYLSVAQGGRLLAVTDLSGAEQVVQFSNTGEPKGSLPLLRRQFLERDTLDWTRYDAALDSWVIIRRANGNEDSLNPAALTVPNPTGDRLTAEVEGSPGGDWLAVRTIDNPPGIGWTDRWDLLAFSQPVPLNVATIAIGSTPFDCTACDGYFVPDRIAGWTHDGQRVVFAFPLADRSGGALVGLDTRVQSVTIPLTGTPSVPGQITPVPDVIARRTRFTADDVVLIWNELNLASECFRATRLATAPSQLITAATPVDIDECDLGDGGPTIFNVPPPMITARDAMRAPRISGTQRPRR